MELYDKNDLEIIENAVDAITCEIEKKKADKIEKDINRDEIMSMNKIVMDFVRTRKRKIYGGYAQNKVIIAKTPSDAFYNDKDIPDIDVYSPDPLQDVVDLSNLFKDAGFKNIIGKDAQHKETYKIFVNQINVIDLSYVPKIIYNKIPYIEIDGIQYVHPCFVYIDMYRILTDPLYSASFRWKKIFPRLYKLQKNYPLKLATKGLNEAYNIPANYKSTVSKINMKILDMIIDKDNFIVVGQYAYNYFLQESGIMKDNNIGKKYKLIPYPFMQLISTNYIPDTINIISELRKLLDDDKLVFKEYYPLWMFTGYSTVLYYNGVPVLHVTSHNNRCIPVRKVLAKFYNEGQVKNLKGFVQLGSFDYVFLMNLISGLRVRVNNIEDKCHYHNIMTSHLIEIRKYYLKKSGKNLLDESLFKSFIPDCVGETIDSKKEHQMLYEKKKREGKIIMFKYEPDKPKPLPKYKFANTSGNEVFKPINQKIRKYFENSQMLSDFMEKNKYEQIIDTNSDYDSDS